MHNEGDKPIPRMSTDLETWLAHYNTEDEILRAALNCQSWILSCEMHSTSRAEHWRERLRLLRTKALLMGISLGE